MGVVLMVSVWAAKILKIGSLRAKMQISGFLEGKEREEKKKKHVKDLAQLLTLFQGSSQLPVFLLPPLPTREMGSHVPVCH